MLAASLAVGRFLLYCVCDKPNNQVEATGDGSEMVKISTACITANMENVLGENS